MATPTIDPRSPLNPRLIRDVKLRLLKMHFDARVGHIGGNLSAIDILLCLHHQIMGPDDQFVLSKGHAAGALYATLHSIGQLSDEELATFHKDGTRLSGHPPVAAIESIPFATGSLGHGLGLANGLALARRFTSRPGHVFCLTSDGEWNEGSCWESLIFAAHQNLNLTLIVDLNGLQGFGTTREVANLDSLADKFRAFGLPTVEVDGHDFVAMADAFVPNGVAGPRAVIAKTSKGGGVSFMKGRMEWHYLPMSQEQYNAACEEITAECAQAAGAAT